MGSYHNILKAFKTIFVSAKAKIENYTDVHKWLYTKQKLGKHIHFIHAHEREFTIPHLC